MMAVGRKLLMGIFLLLLCLIVIQSNLRGLNRSKKNINSGIELSVNKLPPIHIKPKREYDCLIKAGNGKGIVYNPPAWYHGVKNLFDELLNTTLNRSKSSLGDGHSGEITNQTLFYLRLVNTSDFIKTVCETGFNAGHSALSWLSGNPNTRVYSFELGTFTYSRRMASFLQAKFPNRLNIIWGDSKLTVPAFAKENPNVKCDLIYIDGGHDYREAKADLVNSRMLANTDHHLLLVDDVPRTEYINVAKVLSEEQKEKRIEVYLKCKYAYKCFMLGRYINI